VQTEDAFSNPTSPADLWVALRELLQWTFALLRNPEDVARRNLFPRMIRAQLSEALRPAEQFLRRLLFLDALKLDPPPRETQHARASTTTPEKDQPAEFDCEHPEQWRVRFIVRERERAYGAASKNTKAGPDPNSPWRLVSTRPLAKRWEALIRAFNDPAPYALRLARLMRKRPEAVARLCAPPAEIRYGVRKCFYALDTLIYAALCTRTDSS